MAEQIIKCVIDDIDGSPADYTRRFSIGGVDYVIDLNERHNRQLDELIQPFVTAARRARGASQAPTRERYQRYRSQRARNAEIREWAAVRGIHVGTKGMIPRYVRELFEADEQRREFNRPEAIRETADQYEEMNPGPMGESLIQQARQHIGDHYKR